MTAEPTSFPDHPPLHLRWHGSGTHRLSHAYLLAQRVLLSDVSIPQLTPLQRSLNSEAVRNALPTPTELGTYREIYDGPGLLTGKETRIVCRQVKDGYVLTTVQTSRFFVSNDGLSVFRIPAGPGCKDARDRDMALLLGPVVLLALALQEVFTLHTSAICFGNKVICFLGESGAGKSTLAEYCQRAVPGAHRLADDMASFAASQCLELLPGFPQPKPPTPQQESDFRDERMRVAGMMWIDPVAQKGVELEPMSAVDTVLKLINSAVATKLFGANTLKSHLAFCTRSAHAISGYRLVYPKTREALSEVASLLKGKFGGVAGQQRAFI